MVEQDLSVDDNGATAGRDAIESQSRRLGDYRIVREIGRGGMGVVYEAEQVSLGRRVALKVLPGHVVGDHHALERFRREAKAAARLHHTNIVPVFEVGQEGEVAFYAMQFIQGQGLEQVIAELRRLLAPGLEAGEPGTGRSEGLEASTTVGTSRVSATSILLKRELLQLAESFLTGHLMSDWTERPATNPPMAKAAVATEGFDSSATAGLAPLVAKEEETPARPGSTSLSGSAMLPGGTHISDIDSSGRRQPFFRSVGQIGRQAAQGLAYAHSRGIIHRDIKPSNLLLDSAGVVWITDFGLAKAEEDGLTATGDILGTFRYMAPERFRGQADARTDVYALGLTLYELLTLRPAYASSDRLKLIEQVKTEEPVPPRSIDRHIPRDLETIVLKAIEKEPGERYQSADAMAEDLRRFLADEPIKARQVSTSERYWRWARRNPVIATLGGVLTTVLIAVTIGSMAAAAYFRESARRETSLAEREQLANEQSQRDRRAAIEERDHSRRLSAGLALDKGIALAEEGHADRGLLWMLEALKSSPETAEGFRKAVRWNLGAWLGQIHETLRIVDTGGPCDYVAFSPDGRSFATGFNPYDRALATPINLWDTASGQKLSSLPGAFAPFAFRPDEKVLVARDDQRRVVAIDLNTGRVLWTTSQPLGEHGQWTEVSPDGSTAFVTYSDNAASWWLSRLDVSTGRLRGEPIQSSGSAAAATDGGIVAIHRVENGKSFIDVLDVASGRRTACWPAAESALSVLLFSPDARSLFVSENNRAVIGQTDSFFGQVWDAGQGRPTTPPMTSTKSAFFTRAADSLVTNTNNMWLVRDAKSGRVRGAGLHAGAAESLDSRPYGRTMLAASGRDVHVWQISPDAELVIRGGTETQTSFTGIEPESRTRDVTSFWTGLWTDGRVAIALAKRAGERALVRFSDPATGRALGRPASYYPGWKFGSFAVSTDGRCLATESHLDGRFASEVRLWDASTGRLRCPPIPQLNYVAALAFQSDGKVLATGDFYGWVRLWDTSTGREIGRPLFQREIVLSLAFSPDGQMLAVGLSNDHTAKPGVRVWETGTRQAVGDLLPSTHPVNRLEFRPDGRALLVDAGPTTRLWDLPRRQMIGEPIMDEVSCGFRRDGGAFLTVGSDGTVKLRDAATAAVISNLLSSTSPATCAAFRGDGALVVAGFADGTARLCDLATSQPVGPPRPMRHGVQHVAFAPDGRTFAAIDEFGESRSWPVAEPVPDAGLDDLTLRIEARTGLRMGTGQAISSLDGPAWRDRLDGFRQLNPTAVQPDDDSAWHESMLSEAERNGRAFAALWHLDRLIAKRPDDWTLYARRARARSLSDESDRFDKAATDYRQAERLGPREQVVDFQAQCVVDCNEAGRWVEALWYLDRLIAARPGDGALYEDRAAVYGKLGREADRQADLARVFELGADQGLVIPRAEELGRAGRWAEAADLAARCGRTGPLSRELAQAWVIACLRARDRAGYREACAAFIACHRPEPTVFWNTLAAASFIGLGEKGLDDYRVPMEWCEKRLAVVPAPGKLARHLLVSALGGLLFRAGREDEAIVRLNEGIDAGVMDFPSDWALLAMAHARKGRIDQARRSLEHLRAAPPDPLASFWEPEELDILRKEAESLVFDAGFPSDPFRGSGPR